MQASTPANVFRSILEQRIVATPTLFSRAGSSDRKAQG
jgi:hypothetical protein